MCVWGCIKHRVHSACNTNNDSSGSNPNTLYYIGESGREFQHRFKTSQKQFAQLIFDWIYYFPVQFIQARPFITQIITVLKEMYVCVSEWVCFRRNEHETSVMVVAMVMGCTFGDARLWRMMCCYCSMAFSYENYLDECTEMARKSERRG